MTSVLIVHPSTTLAETGSDEGPARIQWWDTAQSVLISLHLTSFWTIFSCCNVIGLNEADGSGMENTVRCLLHSHLPLVGKFLLNLIVRQIRVIRLMCIVSADLSSQIWTS